MKWERILEEVLAGFTPVLPQLIGIAALVIVLGCPVPGRGPRLFQAQDPWRLFKYEARRAVMSRAGNRCEGSAFLAWGRCSEVAASMSAAEREAHTDALQRKPTP